MYKKGSIGTTISLVLFIVLAGITFYACSNAFMMMDNTKDSFYDTLSMMSKVNQMESGSSKNVVINLDENTLILGFNSNQNEMKFLRYKDRPGTTTYQSTTGDPRGAEGKEIQQPTESHYVFERPIECPKDVHCMCYMGGSEIEKTEINKKETLNYNWYNMECKAVHSIDKNSKLKMKVNNQEYDGLVINSDLLGGKEFPLYVRMDNIMIKKTDEGLLFILN